MQRTHIIVGSAMALGLSLLGLWAYMSRSPETGDASLAYVDDAREIAGYAALGEAGIVTSENFVGHQIREIVGIVRNVGDRTLHSVQLRLAFNDFDGGVVYEAEEEAIRAPLPPGEERSYTLRFENLPTSWNYRLPGISIVRVGYDPA